MRDEPPFTPPLTTDELRVALARGRAARSAAFFAWFWPDRKCKSDHALARCPTAPATT